MHIRKLETMSWSSILPSDFVYIEVWITRLFVRQHPHTSLLLLLLDQQLTLSQLFLGALVLGPWLLLVVYDFFVYVFRVVTYEIPFIGGRARNRPRPRAPSLSERPGGEPRIRMPALSTETTEQDESGGAESMQRLGAGPNLRRRAEDTVRDE